MRQLLVEAERSSEDKAVRSIHDWEAHAALGDLMPDDRPCAARRPGGDRRGHADRRDRRVLRAHGSRKPRPLSEAWHCSFGSATSTGQADAYATGTATICRALPKPVKGRGRVREARQAMRRPCRRATLRCMLDSRRGTSRARERLISLRFHDVRDLEAGHCQRPRPLARRRAVAVRSPPTAAAAGAAILMTGDRDRREA